MDQLSTFSALLPGSASPCIDHQLTFVDHVIRITGRCLRQLRSIRRTSTTDAAIALINALIISRIDYCNAVPVGVYGDWSTLAAIPQCPQCHSAFIPIVSKRMFDNISSTIRDVLQSALAADATTYIIQSYCSINCAH